MACTSKMNLNRHFFTIILALYCIFLAVNSEDDREKWKKKDIRDYTDADLERLYDQWEEADEDELPEDELPEWKRKPASIDLSNMDPNDPEGVLKMSKKGKTLMLFASVSGTPTERESEQITQIWQSSLFNAGIEVQRYMVGEARAIFMLKDGSKAWDIKDYLIMQDRCLEVTIEGKSYPGKASPEYQGPSSENKSSKKSKNAKEKKKSENDIKNDNKKSKKEEKSKKSSKDTEHKNSKSDRKAKKEEL